MATRQEEIIVKLGADTKELQKELGMTRKQVAAFSRDIQNDLANGYMPETWKLHAKYQDKLREGLDKTKFGFKSMGMAATDTFKALAAGASATDVIGAGLQRMTIGLSAATGGFAAMGVAAAVGIGQAINAAVNSYYDVENKKGEIHETNRQNARANLLEARRIETEALEKQEKSHAEAVAFRDAEWELARATAEASRAAMKDEVAVLKDIVSQRKDELEMAKSKLEIAQSSGSRTADTAAEIKFQQAKLALINSEKNLNKAIGDEEAKRLKRLQDYNAAKAEVLESSAGEKLTVGELAAGVADREGNLIQGRFAGVAQDIEDLDVDRRQALNFGEIDYAKELQAKITDMKEKLYEAGVIEKPVELKMEEHLAEIRKGVTVKPTE